jgi:hypothetical protein
VADGLDPTDLSSPSSDERLSGSSMSDWLSGMSAKHRKYPNYEKNKILLKCCFMNADVALLNFQLKIDNVTMRSTTDSLSFETFNRSNSSY